MIHVSHIWVWTEHHSLYFGRALWSLLHVMRARGDGLVLVYFSSLSNQWTWLFLMKVVRKLQNYYSTVIVLHNSQTLVKSLLVTSLYKAVKVHLPSSCAQSIIRCLECVICELCVFEVLQFPKHFLTGEYIFARLYKLESAGCCPEATYCHRPSQAPSGRRIKHTHAANVLFWVKLFFATISKITLIDHDRYMTFILFNSDPELLL